MVPAVWLLVAFLAGTATGAFLVSIYRLATISRIREEFRAELEALIENRGQPGSEESYLDRPHRAA